MNIRLFIIVCCLALIQFQGKAAIMQGSYFVPFGVAGSTIPITFSYSIVTPSPDYILYFPLNAIPIIPSLSTSVAVDQVLVPFTFSSDNNLGVHGIYIKLQNPNLAVAGSKIVINTFITLPPFAGLFQLGQIQTAASDGTIIDNTTGFNQPIILEPKAVTFLTTTAITNTGFTANWSSSMGADSYHLDVSIDPGFATFLPGYSNLNIGNVLTYTMSSLSPNTTYYFRLTAYFQPFRSPTSLISVLTTKSITSTATVSLSNLTAIYDGLYHAATATTTPAGLTVGITYNGSSTVPTNAGTYAVVATVSDANYQGSATGSLVILKATTNPVLSNLTATYNGSTHAATVTTIPAGLNVGITYNGSSTVPTNAGTYAVATTVNDANYQGSATGSLVISKATITLGLTNLTITYDGLSHALTATTTPAGLSIGITYNGSSTVPTNVGIYTVVATVSDVNYQGSITGSLVISKATVNPVLNNLTATYNGSNHAVTATTVPTGLTVGITYNGSSTVPTNAGTYAVVATVSDANYQGSATGSLVISKAIANPVLSNLTATYDGSAIAATATTTPLGLTVGITYNGSSTVPTNAGTYPVIATVSDANYQGSATGSLVISKAIANPVLSNLTTIYNGSPHVFVATTTPSGLNVIKTYNGFSSIPTNVGTYAVVATVSDANYQGSATGSLVISKVTANPVLSNLSATYNGSTHGATATTTPAGLTVGIMYNGSSTVPTNAGIYAVAATVSDANYQGSATGSLAISKATSNPILSNLSVVYNGSTHAATATTNPSGLNVTITYDGSSTIPVEVGTYNVVATVSDANYQGSSTATLTIASVATGVTGKILTDIKMYPNPCKEFVNIDANISIIKAIRIVNIEGVTVMQKDDCLQQERIDISSLAKGVYMVVVDAETGRGAYRLIVY